MSSLDKVKRESLRCQCSSCKLHVEKIYLVDCEVSSLKWERAEGKCEF